MSKMLTAGMLGFLVGVKMRKCTGQMCTRQPPRKLKMKPNQAME